MRLSVRCRLRFCTRPGDSPSPVGAYGRLFWDSLRASRRSCLARTICHDRCRAWRCVLSIPGAAGIPCPSPAPHHFVIAKAFYPLLLMVSHKVGVHHHPSGMPDTLGGIIARLSLTLYALRCRVLFPVTSELAMKQIVYPLEAVSLVSSVDCAIFQLENLTPLSQRLCGIAYGDVDI